MNESNEKSQSSFTEVRVPKKSSGSERPAIVIQSSKGKIYIHNHADQELIRAVPIKEQERTS